MDICESNCQIEDWKTSRKKNCSIQAVKVCSGKEEVDKIENNDDEIEGNSDDDDDDDDNRQMLLVEYRLRWALHYSVTSNSTATSTMPL